MNVFVIVTPGFPKDETDTTCLPAFQQFALSLKKLYPTTALIVLSFQYPFEKKEYLWHGIKVISLGGKNQGGFKRIYTWIKAKAALKKTAKQNSIIGLVSLWIGECAYVANNFAKKNQIKHFTWIIGQDARKENKYVGRVRPRSGQLMAMSDFLKDEFFRNHGIHPAYVIENGVNTSVFPMLNTGKREIDILGVGSLSSLKNYTLFIEVVAEVKKIFPGVKAAIAGTGEEEAQLKNLAGKLSLQNNLVFLGSLPHTQIFDCMNNSRLFLHTSRYEGNSTVLMEALCSGCQVISTCALSHAPVKNLSVRASKEDLIKSSLELLQENKTPEKIIFNTMDRSAEKIMNLFLQ
jgi:hypothetical protein